jgi:hypothetical protein
MVRGDQPSREEEIDSLEQDNQDVREVFRYDVRRPLVWTSEGFHDLLLAPRRLLGGIVNLSLDNFASFLQAFP